MNALVYASEQIKTFHVPQCASSENKTLQKRNEQELCLLKKSVHISSTLLVADSYRIHAKCTILKAFQSLTNLLSFYGGRTPTSSSGKRKKTYQSAAGGPIAVGASVKLLKMNFLPPIGRIQLQAFLG